MLAHIGEHEIVIDGRHLVEPGLAELALYVVLDGEAEATVRVECGIRRSP